MVLRIAKFNLIKMVTDTIDLMTLQAQEKKLSIQCHISSKTPSLLIGDEKVLQKILVHLIDNAIKYTFQGEISINVGLAAEDASYADIQFTIKDTGIGIPDDKQETIFSAFYQIDSSSTKQYGGTGLGLALAKQLVTLMEGNIFVESTPDIGSTFWFSVRLKKCWD
jgi:signal transduction histidine kinase